MHRHSLHKPVRLHAVPFLSPFFCKRCPLLLLTTTRLSSSCSIDVSIELATAGGARGPHHHPMHVNHPPPPLPVMFKQLPVCIYFCHWSVWCVYVCASAYGMPSFGSSDCFFPFLSQTRALQFL